MTRPAYLLALALAACSGSGGNAGGAGDGGGSAGSGEPEGVGAKCVGEGAYESDCPAPGLTCVYANRYSTSGTCREYECNSDGDCAGNQTCIAWQRRCGFEE